MTSRTATVRKCGHPKTPENSRASNGGCRICHGLDGRRAREWKAAEVGREYKPRDPLLCPNGHDKTPENTRPGRSDCLICHREQERARVRRKALEAGRSLRLVNPEAFPCGHPRTADNTRPGRNDCVACHRARRLASGDADTREWLTLLAGDPCAYCGQAMAEVDHIEPFSRGGANHWSNFAAACRPCNRQKYNRPLLSFLLSMRPMDREAS